MNSTELPINCRRLVTAPGAYQRELTMSTPGAAANTAEQYRDQAAHTPPSTPMWRAHSLMLAAWWQSIADTQTRNDAQGAS